MLPKRKFSHVMFQELLLLYRVANDDLMSTVEGTLIYGVFHVDIIVLGFCFIRLFNSSIESLYTAVPLLFIFIAITLFIRFVETTTKSFQSVIDRSRTFLHEFAANRPNTRLDRLCIRSYRPLEFSLACSLQINPTFLLIVHTFTLNGLLTLILTYR